MMRALNSQRCRIHATLQVQRAAAQPRTWTLSAVHNACRHRHVACTAAATDQKLASPPPKTGQAVKVRFAPSPTGNLHVGGARTALFNWLYAKHCGGSMVLRVEDTDAARSTQESEQAVLEDLKWLGISYDEGPDVGGPNGPYRQSERKEIYNAKVKDLLDKNLVYPCFCTDEELSAMKKRAEELSLPPVYRGKWASASQEEVQAELDKGTPHCYRFRVTPNKDVIVRDMIRGDVKFNTDTLGDFVVMRSNGLPVYNFCVAVDDALMEVTHVLRAEEHLPNTLRQLLIYEALGYTPPKFGHMSLILAPDKSKLSKRHGATSVGEFRQQGFLAPAMMNYLSLLGWNDGSEKEIYTVDELAEAFTVERITKSAAVFDKTKLSWMNGQHLRALPKEEVEDLVGRHLVDAGVVSKPDTPFVKAAIDLMQQNLELVQDSDAELKRMMTYPLAETLASGQADLFKESNLKDVAQYVLDQWQSGALREAIEGGMFKKWIKALGKEKGYKGKNLFMPVRIALTGQMAGPEVGDLLNVLGLEDGECKVEGYTKLYERMDILRDAIDDMAKEPAS